MRLLTPSNSTRVNVVRLGLLGSAITGFFLFTGNYWFPGGANHFTQYADALASGSTLIPHLAQRDVGYPLLIFLSGYTLTGSLIPITLIHALFSILMPVLVYASVQQASKPIGYYTGLFAAVSLAPILGLKSIHHDHAYIFFIILSVAMASILIQTQKYRYLYLLTLAALMASVTRPAGTFLVPLFLTIAYVIGPRKIVHYIACVAIFFSVTAVYQWHRYEIFNVRQHTSIPSFTGQQIFYNLYVNSKEFGLRLSPELGPNMARITDSLFKNVQPSLREARYVYAYKGAYQPPDEFVEENIYAFTPEAFIKRVYEEPCWDYYVFLFDAEKNDQVFLGASWEILRAYTLYPARYALRNAVMMLFRPGYSRALFTVGGALAHEKVSFPPGYLVLTVGADVRARAAAELRFQPRPQVPIIARGTFTAAREYWRYSYQPFVIITLALMVTAWAALAVALACRLRPVLNICKPTAELATREFIGPLIAVSALFAHDLLITCLFVEPSYRYHHFLLLLRVVIAGYGAIALLRLLPYLLRRPMPRLEALMAPTSRSPDAFERYCASPMGPLLLLVVISLLFSTWVWFMLWHTS